MKKTLTTLVLIASLFLNSCSALFTKQENFCMSKNQWSYRPQKEITNLDKAKNKLYNARLAVSESTCDYVVYVKSAISTGKEIKAIFSDFYTHLRFEGSDKIIPLSDYYEIFKEYSRLNKLK